MRRDVVRLVTPGTLTEDALLDARAANNYLAALGRKPGEAPIRAGVWLDISTGEFCVRRVQRRRLAAELARLAPARSCCCADALAGARSSRAVSTGPARR